jgi:hypothetical protein
MSAAARKKLAATQRARWAKWKKNKETSEGYRGSMCLFSILYADSVDVVFTWYLNDIKLLF